MCSRDGPAGGLIWCGMSWRLNPIFSHFNMPYRYWSITIVAIIVILCIMIYFDILCIMIYFDILCIMISFDILCIMIFILCISAILCMIVCDILCIVDILCLMAIYCIFNLLPYYAIYYTIPVDIFRTFVLIFLAVPATWGPLFVVFDNFYTSPKLYDHL